MAHRFEHEQTNQNTEGIPQRQEDTSPGVPSIPQTVAGDIPSSSQLDPTVLSYLERFSNTLQTVMQRLDHLDQGAQPKSNAAVQPPKTPTGLAKARQREIACAASTAARQRKGKQVAKNRPKSSTGPANTDCAPSRIPVALRLGERIQPEPSHAMSGENPHKSAGQGDSHHCQSNPDRCVGSYHTPRVSLHHRGVCENFPNNTMPSHGSGQRVSRLVGTTGRGEEESNLRSFLNRRSEGRTHIVESNPQVAPLPQIEKL